MYRQGLLASKVTHRCRVLQQGWVCATNRSQRAGDELHACHLYITVSGVRLCWELEEPKGPKGSESSAGNSASHQKPSHRIRSESSEVDSSVPAISPGYKASEQWCDVAITRRGELKQSRDPPLPARKTHKSPPSPLGPLIRPPHPPWDRP